MVSTSLLRRVLSVFILLCSSSAMVRLPRESCNQLINYLSSDSHYVHGSMNLRLFGEESTNMFVALSRVSNLESCDLRFFGCHFKDQKRPSECSFSVPLLFWKIHELREVDLVLLSSNGDHFECRGVRLHATRVKRNVGERWTTSTPVKAEEETEENDNLDLNRLSQESDDVTMTEANISVIASNLTAETETNSISSKATKQITTKTTSIRTTIKPKKALTTKSTVTLKPEPISSKATKQAAVTSKEGKISMTARTTARPSTSITTQASQKARTTVETPAAETTAAGDSPTTFDPGDDELLPNGTDSFNDSSATGAAMASVREMHPLRIFFSAALASLLFDLLR